MVATALAATANDSYFVTRDRTGRTMVSVAPAVEDGLTCSGKAWGVGVEEGGSLFVDRNDLATLSGQDTYVVLGDHQPEQAVPSKPPTFSDFKIRHLGPGGTYDFGNRPTCGYCTRRVVNGAPAPTSTRERPSADAPAGRGPPGLRSRRTARVTGRRPSRPKGRVPVRASGLVLVEEVDVHRVGVHLDHLRAGRPLDRADRLLPDVGGDPDPGVDDLVRVDPACLDLHAADDAAGGAAARAPADRSDRRPASNTREEAVTTRRRPPAARREHPVVTLEGNPGGTRHRSLTIHRDVRDGRLMMLVREVTALLRDLASGPVCGRGATAWPTAADRCVLDAVPELDGGERGPMPFARDLASGRLMLPATAVTDLLRALAASTTCGCRGTRCEVRAAAALLAGVADRIDVACIAVATG